MRAFGFVGGLHHVSSIGFAATLLIGLGFVAPAFGQATWAGSTATTWNNAAAWSTSSVPTASTAAVLQPSAAVNMTIPNGVIATATSVNFANASNISLVVSNGGRLNVGGAITDTGTGSATISVANTTEANAASILTATSIAAYAFEFNAAGTQFLTMNADVSLTVQLILGSATGTATYRQTGGTLTTQNGSYGLTLIEAASANPTGTATFILDGGRVMSDRIGVANANGNNGVTRYAANGSFVFNSGTVQPRSSAVLYFQNGSARTSSTTTDTQLNTSKPVTISLAGTGVHEFNATGGNIFITPSAQIRDQAGQAGTLLKTGTASLILTGNGPVAVNDWTGASTVNAGFLTVDYNQIAGTATSSGTTALSNAYSPSSQLVLNGGNFTLTGRPNAVASSQTNRSINAGSYNLTVTSTAGLVVGQAVANPNLPAGTYIRRITNATTVELNAMITGTANLSGQTFDFAAANFTNSQTINSVALQQTGTITVNPAGDSTLLTFGTVSGAAGFVKAGTGTLRLTGPLSYSGATNLSAGTVDFAPASGTSTLAGSVIGSGTFLKSGNGTTIIGGTGNTFSGPLSITGGTLQIGTATTSNIATQAVSVNSAVTVGAGANLVFKNSNALQYASSFLVSGTIATDAAGVSGGGFINKLGNGPITMSGGAIVANTGGNASNFQSYALGGDVTVTGSGPSTLSVAPGALATQAGVHLTWSTVAGTTRTFTVADVTGNAAADLVVSARLINAASTFVATNLAKAGLGTMLLSGSNGYTGSTTIDAGTLVVNGSILGTTGVTVAPGAILGGSGSIGGLTTVSGTLSPGNSPGVLTLESLSLAAGATTLIEVQGVSRGGQYDGIDISAASGLAYGGTLAFDFATLLSDNTTLDIFSFTGAPSGAFTSILSTGSYAGTWTNNNDGTHSLQQGSQTLTFSQSSGDVVIVPEPGALLLAACGTAFASWTVWRRRRTSSTRR
jgi:autotransporter-associated beta strand protein